MKDFLGQSERMLHSWNHRGPSHLTLSSASKEIYLLRNGVATNYFKPTMTTPYSSKVNRCLISNVINKVSHKTDVSVPLLARYMVDTVTSGIKTINSVVSPLAASASTMVSPLSASTSAMAASASARLQSDDLSSVAIIFAEEPSHKHLKDFNYGLYLKIKSKNINFKGIAQEQEMDFSLKMDLKLHPEMFCTKLIGGGNAVVFGKGRDEQFRIVVPRSLREDILQLHHDSLIDPTADSNFDTLVYDTFTWNGIHKDVKEYVEKARREKALQENAERSAGEVIRIGVEVDEQDILDGRKEIVRVINDKMKTKWWKSLLTKKGHHSKNDASDSLPALVKVSDYSCSTASGLSSSHAREKSNVTEEFNDDNYRLIAELPGVKTENFKVDFFQGGRVLKVSGTQHITRGNLSEKNQFEKCFSLAADLDS